MTTTRLRQEIRDCLLTIEPLDSIEQQHRDFVLKWIDSGAELCRLKKPATPPIHLVSYFLVFSPEHAQVLLVDHKKAACWLPSGGHVERGEHPKETVIREVQEELSIEADFLFEDPLFVTMTQTDGKEMRHVDVSLWYVLNASPKDVMVFDEEEFHQIRWFGIDKLPFKRTDPHLKRFMEKMLACYSAACATR